MIFNRRTLLHGMGAAMGAAWVLPKLANAQDSKVLRIAARNDFQSLDPAFSSTVAESDIQDSLYVRLISYDGVSWNTQLDAATSIEQVDPTHIRFALRPGIAWTNGFGEVSAEDVKYSFERIANPEMGSPWKGDWEFLDRVDVTGEREGVIVLKQPFSPVWRTTLPWNAGLIVCKEAVEQAGGRFTTEPPAQCGPYLLKEWRPKQRTVLMRNPDWNGPRPDFDEVHIFPIDDRQVAEQGFLAGEFDFINVAPSSLPIYEANPPAGVTVSPRPMVGMEWLGLNTEHPLFEDLRVRQAIARAIDVDAVVDAAYFGGAERATGVIASGLPGHRDASPYPARDVEAAKALLAEAGVSGFDARLSIINATDLLTMAQVIQANLSEIGINVEIEPLESGTFWTLGVEESGDTWKDLQMFIHRWGNGPDPSWATKFYTCDGVGQFNWERWCSEEYTKLNSDAMAETDDAKRAEIYGRMATLLDESGAYILLTHGVQLLLYREGITPGVTPDGNRLSFSKFKQA
jgi:peptide/nickel transport system substrate-binding protein